MKILIILLAIILTGCVSYKNDTGWHTQSLFKDIPTSHNSRITVFVLPDIYETCKRFGRVLGCTIDGTIYVQGENQNVTMKLSPEFIQSIPNDEGRAGDMLAEKLKLKLEFNHRTTLGHEFLDHT